MYYKIFSQFIDIKQVQKYGSASVAAIILFTRIVSPLRNSNKTPNFEKETTQFHNRHSWSHITTYRASIQHVKERVPGMYVKNGFQKFNHVQFIPYYFVCYKIETFKKSFFYEN